MQTAIRNYEYRIYPTAAQKTKLNLSLSICANLYNKLLEAKIEEYKQTKNNLSLYDCHGLIQKWKKEDTGLNKVHSQVLQNTAERVDLSFKGFFRRLKCKTGNPGFPRYKSASRYNSLCYPQPNGKWYGKSNEYILLGKIGKVRVKKHRECAGKIKRITVKRREDKWFIVLAVQLLHAKDIENTEQNRNVGIDLGLKHFATFSDGTKIDMPRYYHLSKRQLARYQRQAVTAKTKTDKQKYYRRARVIHTKISNRRKDLQHKLSRQLVNEFGFIAVEDLNIKSMQKQGWHHMNRHIADVSWNAFVNKLCYKAEEAGCQVVKVNPSCTSKICSSCGALVEKGLDERVHQCNCGLEIDRDVNAAINILRLGLQSLGVESLEDIGQ